jgi:RNA polymerase sigma-70 factor (ECF subfamily)
MIKEMESGAGVDVADGSDEDLFLEYRESGDPALFTELVRRNEKELLSYLRKFMGGYQGGDQLAEDAYQGTWLNVHLKSDQFEKGKRFRPWLYTIARNQAIDVQRRHKRHQLVSLDRTGGEDPNVGTLIDLLLSTEVEPEIAAKKNENRDKLATALQELPEVFRQVVILVHYQGLKYREAAEVIQRPVGTVKSRLHSALEKMKESIRRAEQADVVSIPHGQAVDGVEADRVREAA